MTPALVVFDGGVEIDPKKVLNRRYMGPTPVEWTRYQFFIDSCFNDPEYNLTDWLKSNTSHRFTINSDVHPGGTFVVIGFESSTDAVMFKMRDGEKAWANNQVKFS